jgi:uncharacterized YigZ family protein
MRYIQEHFTQTLEVKQSKFIAHVIPYSLYDETLFLLKEEHPKARHFVVAWRYINEFDQIVEHCSDDGEPKGTSGKPTLAVLAGNGFINTAVIIVRYFGGTKLGTGGLVRAYSDACNNVLIGCDSYVYVKLQDNEFLIKYSDVSRIEYALKEKNITVLQKRFDERGAVFRTSTDEESYQNFFNENRRLIIPI